MPTKTKIYFIHEGKAAYPEIAAYTAFMEPWFESEEVTQDEAARKEDLADAICWHIMGFYPRRLPARLVIHDYRSLSTGMMRQAKDRLKWLVNAKPDIRIFQNHVVQEALGFSDNRKAIMLPMGVPDFITQFRTQSHERIADYCYIGAMSAERRSQVMLDSFIRRFGSEKTLVVYGPGQEPFKSRYASFPNIRFKGSVPQADLFDQLTRVGACVCYFPNHYPHLLQTPTKMLEYAALGLRIIANEQVQSIATSRQYEIKVLWGPANDIFASAPEDFAWDDNGQLNVQPLVWSSVIKASGILDAITARIKL
jgi:hypothetical protein